MYVYSNACSIAIKLSNRIEWLCKFVAKVGQMHTKMPPQSFSSMKYFFGNWICWHLCWAVSWQFLGVWAAAGSVCRKSTHLMNTHKYTFFFFNSVIYKLCCTQLVRLLRNCGFLSPAGKAHNVFKEPQCI